MNGEPILQLHGVAVPTRRDTEIAALEGVDWSVRAGEFWVVGGLQGSGKSDLIFMLAGLSRPLRGGFTLLGQDMTQEFGEDFSEVRRRIGVVFDDARLFNHLTMAENVSLPARYHNDLHEDEVAGWTEPLLRATGLERMMDAKPGTITAAWRRRGALARALALRPELLLLENPVRGLDARHTAWWIEFLIRLWGGHDLLRGQPVTVIVSADDFDPWLESGAKFATVHEGGFTVMGDQPPNRSAPWPSATANRGN